MPAKKIDYAALVARARADYSAYLPLVWRQLSGGRAPLTEYELDAATWAVTQSPGRDHRRFLFGHREFGKSTFITRAVMGWKWLTDPTLTGSIYAKSNDKAIKDLKAARALLGAPLLQHLVPPASSWHSDHGHAFHVNGATDRAVPSLSALGSTSQSTGGRNHVVLFDDFETLENSITLEARERTAERGREIVRTSRQDALIVGMGTYARDESIYQLWIDDKWEHRVYPILYPTDEEIKLLTDQSTGRCLYAPIVLTYLERGFDYLGRPAKPGQIIQPERWSWEHIQTSCGYSYRAEFRRHYMGVRRSSTSDECPLRLSNLMVLDCLGPTAPITVTWGLLSSGQPTTLDIEVDIAKGSSDRLRKPAAIDQHAAPFTNTVAFLDPAGFGKDEMAWAVWSSLAGFYYCRALRATRLRSDDQQDPDRLTIQQALEGQYPVHSVVGDIKRFGVKTLLVEAQFGGTILADRLRATLLQHNVPCTVLCEPARGQKELRLLAAAQPLTADHRVVIDENVARDTEFQRQYTRLTAAPGSLPHDDRIEAFAAGLSLIAKDDLDVPQTTRVNQVLHGQQDDLLDLLDPKRLKPVWGHYGHAGDNATNPTFA